jgi:ATP-dependent DNA ligase
MWWHEIKYDGYRLTGVARRVFRNRMMTPRLDDQPI